MQPLSIGKQRGIQQCTSTRVGLLPAWRWITAKTCAAPSTRKTLTLVPNQILIDFKLEVTAVLAVEATAVLLDPEYSAAQAVAAGVIPNNAGLVVAVEATDYTGDPNARQSRILPGWSVQKAKRMGASMIKLLVYYHPDDGQHRKLKILPNRLQMIVSIMTWVLCWNPSLTHLIRMKENSPQTKNVMLLLKLPVN